MGTLKAAPKVYSATPNVGKVVELSSRPDEMVSEGGLDLGQR